MIPFDLSWKNLIYGPRLLNAQINSVKTPDMMKLWGYIRYVALTNALSTTSWLTASSRWSKVVTLGDMTQFS